MYINTLSCKMNMSEVTAIRLEALPRIIMISNIPLYGVNMVYCTCTFYVRGWYLYMQLHIYCISYLRWILCSLCFWMKWWLIDWWIYFTKFGITYKYYNAYMYVYVSPLTCNSHQTYPKDTYRKAPSMELWTITYFNNAINKWLTMRYTSLIHFTFF